MIINVELYGESQKKIIGLIKKILFDRSAVVSICKHNDYAECTKRYEKKCKMRLYDESLAKKIYFACKPNKIQIEIG